MNKFIGGLLGFFCTLVGIFALPLVPFVMLCIKWDNVPTTGSYNLWPTIRGSLPKWLYWFETPDERFPGGLYEPAVRNVLDRYGKVICSMYWYTRNSLHGLLPVFAKTWYNSLPGALNAPVSQNYVTWQRFGLRGGYGWRWKPQNVENSLWAEVPYFTIRLN